MFSILNNSRGFSLVAVMIAAGIGGTVILAMSQMLITQHQSVSYLEDRLSKTEVQNRLRSEFLNSDTCIANFNLTPMENRINLNQLVTSDGSHILNTGSKHDQLEVASIHTQSQGATIPANGSGRMNLVVGLRRLRSSRGANDIIAIDLELRVGLDSARRIISCSLLEGSNSVGANSCIIVGYKRNNSGNYVSYSQIIPHGQTMRVFGATGIPAERPGRHIAYTVHSYLTSRQVSCNNSLTNTLSETQTSPSVILRTEYYPDTTDGGGAGDQ